MQHAIFFSEVAFHLSLSLSFIFLEFPECSIHSGNLLIKPLEYRPHACAQAPAASGNTALPLTTPVTQEIHKPHPLAWGAGDCSDHALIAPHNLPQMPAYIPSGPAAASTPFLGCRMMYPTVGHGQSSHFSLPVGKGPHFSIYEHFREIPPQGCLRAQILQLFLS